MLKSHSEIVVNGTELKLPDGEALAGYTRQFNVVPHTFPEAVFQVLISPPVIFAQLEFCPNVPKFDPSKFCASGAGLIC
ncbi:MAG: hypothetical protein C0430_06620 [Flavobacterium sp.]|nr:hypothetical protein [Flavobacterium sp.]